MALKTLGDSIIDMDRVDQEDRVSIQQRVASETGFTGRSQLRRLYALYQFDVLHTLCLKS